MLFYILRRLLLALPTLLIISMTTFGLSRCAPKDPVAALHEHATSDPDPAEQAAAYRRYAVRLDLEKPDFYFSLTTADQPDTLYKVYPPDRRKRLSRIAAQARDWNSAARFDEAATRFWRAADRLPDSLPQIQQVRTIAGNLLIFQRLDQLLGQWADLQDLREPLSKAPAYAALSSALDTLGERLNALAAPRSAPQLVFRWHGQNNQYHNWLFKLLTADSTFLSYTGSPVWTELKSAMGATLIVNGLAIALAYVAAILLGVGMARRYRRRFDRWAQRGLLMLYAVPGFWLGSMLIIFFATSDQGLHLLPGTTFSIRNEETQSLGAWYWQNRLRFILPILTVTLNALAVLTLQMRGSMLEVLGQDYIRTARAKGADERRVHWYHALCNALFPLITVFAGVFPMVFAGSLVVEYLFDFPGMGIKTQEAFMRGDFPVLFAILLAAAALTVLGSLIADLLYAWADPRVKF